VADASLRAAERVGGVRELVEQLRAGVVSKQTVELAAAVGDPVACACLGVEVREIGGYGSAHAAVRLLDQRRSTWVAVGAARCALEASGRANTLGMEAVKAAEAWVLAPSYARRAAAALKGREAFLSKVQAALIAQAWRWEEVLRG
jgi:hypothetical protein